jgi:hypothetical protein
MLSPILTVSPEGSAMTDVSAYDAQLAAGRHDRTDAKTRVDTSAMQSDRLGAPVYTRWFSARRAPLREGWYEIMSADGDRLMADWRKIGDVMAFWIYAEFGAIPIRKEIDHVKKWRGMLASANASSDG